MSEVREEIAKVGRTTLGYEDHGIFTCMLHLNFGSSGQGAAGYSLDEPRHDADAKYIGRFGTAFVMEWVIRAMKACGVREWDEVKGRTVLCLRDEQSRIVGIKPLPTEKGETFIFAELAAECQEGR